MKFDFDHWKELAQQDPEAFESLRKQAIEKAMDWEQVSNRRKLEGLQFRLDMERRKASNPLAACIHLSKKMLDYFYNHLLPTIAPISAAPERDQSSAGTTQAKVLPFPAKPPKQNNKPLSSDFNER